MASAWESPWMSSHAAPPCRRKGAPYRSTTDFLSPEIVHVRPGAPPSMEPPVLIDPPRCSDRPGLVDPPALLEPPDAGLPPAFMDGPPALPPLVVDVPPADAPAAPRPASPPTAPAPDVASLLAQPIEIASKAIPTAKL